MQEDMDVVKEAFQQGKELGLDEGQKTGYYDGLTEGRFELEETMLEVFAEACLVGRKEGATKEKEHWIGAGHTESGVCQAGRKDFVDVTIMVGTLTRRFTDTAVVTELHDDSNLTNVLFTKSEPFSWADDVSSIPIHSVKPLVSSTLMSLQALYAQNSWIFPAN
ncbi:hypothetical protein EDD85DRAFT_1004104 [Armillaria nabsnona]|nr:hypothetical protein EDD85DRAFT_1004104 [Armillaria nabsnona]